MPCAGEERLLDQAVKAMSVEWSRAAALETLQDIAEGKPKEVIVGAALRAGLEVRPARSLYEYPCGRAYAMDRIGASGLPEAIEYLRTMTIARVGPDGTQSIYPASQVALQKALLRQETDPERQVAFLEEQLAKPAVGEVASWAVEELCNRGNTSSLPVIQKMVKGWWTGPRGEEQIRWCEARMEIVNRDPDRAKALGSALSLRKLWAIHNSGGRRGSSSQLRDMNSDEADAVIDRFLAQIGQSFPKNFAAATTEENQALRGLVQGIGISLPSRSPVK